MFNVRMEAAKAAIKALIAQHMDNLEAQLKLEREFPEWDAEGERQFEVLDGKTNAVTREIANALALALHPARYESLTQENAKDAAKRNAEFDSWCENMSREHDERQLAVERA